MTPDEHAAQWRSAHHTGWTAYVKWQREGWPERDCVAAAVAAALIYAAFGEAAGRENGKRLEGTGDTGGGSS